jgi:predicted metal-dependent hydrolase
MASPAVDPRFGCGIAAFNEEKFFEAHEVWEQVWKHAEGEQKTIYQGLIQAAAALLHVQRGNHRGAISTYLKARSKLERAPEVWMGIGLGRFRCELANYFAALWPTLHSSATSSIKRRRAEGGKELPSIRSVE